MRTHRKTVGISQEVLADRCGVHRTFVGHIERGQVSPTLGTLVLLAEGLGVRVVDLVEGL